MPRVLHLGPLHTFHLRRWAELTREAGYEPHIGGLPLRGMDAVDFGGVAESVHTAPALRAPLGTAARLAWLRRVVRAVDPDVVHAHHLQSWGALAALAGARPLVISVWGSDVYFDQGSRRAAAAAIRRADRLLAPSPDMVRELIRAGADPDLCEHVDLGVDLDRFAPAEPGDAARARSELGLGEGPVVFSFRGGYPAYNIATVAEAFGLLHERRPDARLLVAHSRSPLSAKARDALERLGGSVTVLGDVRPERMPDCYRAATVGVSIPSSDGSPRSVWEGLACGLPMVLSDLPQIRERVEGNPAVRLVPIESRAVADALSELVAPDSSVAAAAREWAVRNVDYRDYRETLRELYERLRVSRPARNAKLSAR